MDIKQIYREETEKDVYTVALMEQRVEHFSDDYVKWLEKQLRIGGVSSSYVVFEDGADEGIEGMIQLSVPFKTIEEAQAYASSWRSRKTYVAKMIE